MERQTSLGTLPTVDVATLRDDFGNRLCCVVTFAPNGQRTVAEHLTTLAAARAFVDGYNSAGRATGSYAEIRAVSGTITAGKRLATRARKTGAA